MSEEERLRKPAWKLWGPYLSERQWGTIREDYSRDGEAWEYFGREAAAYRAYRWGEDGIAGISDDEQRLCLSLVLWNGADPFLKERFFGLTNHEGNHGEDVKEVYYYLDAAPTHSYLKMLYKYPQRAFPYARVREESGRRGRLEPEFELLDTDAFDEDRYFDVFVEYAKATPEDILMLVSVRNRGSAPARMHVLPQLWFRNTWSWGYGSEKPVLRALEDGSIEAHHAQLGEYRLFAEGSPDLLFCDNETNQGRLTGRQDARGYYKDAFHEYIVHGNQGAVNPARIGTKAAAHYAFEAPAGGGWDIRLRLTRDPSGRAFADFDAVLETRRRETDEFYRHLQQGVCDDDARQVQRQALAGMVWNKQFYAYNVPQWLRGDPAFAPPPAERVHGRNSDWIHLDNADIISMPDKWEYPWYAVWDLAFHTVPLALVDPEFAKEQLVLMAREWYMHPNGALPAYEWNFGDANPPVHAWATWRVFQIDRKRRRTGTHGDRGDLAFLERVFHKLLLNFTWWVNREDPAGRNVFQGGFLGLDNIGVFDRSKPLPTGGEIHQSDATSWMAMYSLNLMRIALELARHNHVYEDIATKFFEHFLGIAHAMTNIGEQGIGLWDEQDGFFYDVLRLPDGRLLPLRVRSLVGLIPLFAVEVLEPGLLDELPGFKKRLEWYLEHRPDLAALVSRWHEPGRGERRLLSLLRGSRMKKLLRRMLDEDEFLSEFGVRSLSRYHLDHPYTFFADGHELTVKYQPAESDSGMFGGNSNWRGPVWMPMNFLMIESLQKFHHYYGDDFRIECPTRSGRFITIDQVAAELTHRLSRLFLRNPDGKRPMYGDCERLQRDPYFRDYVLFHEYFHGETGRGLGASHQTGWTGLVAKLLQPRAGY